jgi:hypothetical protein
MSKMFNENLILHNIYTTDFLEYLFYFIVLVPDQKTFSRQQQQKNHYSGKISSCFKTFSVDS